MSVSGTSTSATSSSGYESRSNYNYLSFFARGSYGRKLEGQRSRDPTLARFEEEKRLWKWMTGVALAFMAITNLCLAVGLITWKMQTIADEAGLTESLYETVHNYMKTGLKAECRPRYRSNQECSQIAAQMFLVANPTRDRVVWSNESHFPSFNITSLGAFGCPGVISDKIAGKFQIQKDSFYQIHSHLLFHSLRKGSRLQHVIIRDHLNTVIPLAHENMTVTKDCTMRDTTKEPLASVEGSCFSSSVLATDDLKAGDLISVELIVDDVKFPPTKYEDVDLIYDGKSSYFGIVTLGKLYK